jgi:caffeoyl-CoA O-methyltransferase
MMTNVKFKQASSRIVSRSLFLVLVVLTPAALAAQAPARPPAYAAAPSAPAAVPATSALTPELERLLKSVKQADRGMLAISEEDGQFLRVMAATTRARQVLEIGGASGYSAIWIGLGLRETGGRLITIEYDPIRAKEAADNVRRAGLSDIVRVVHGDAFQEIPKIPGTFDMVFLDAWKKDYKRFLDLVLPRVNRGGLFLAHNVVNKGTEMPDFLNAIQRSPALLTAIVTPSGEGVSVSYKK